MLPIFNQMIYKKDVVQFDQISPSDFERLCYELLLKYNFTELTWRQGGQDRGRDLEGNLYFENQFQTQKTKWFFECKKYTNGLNVDDLSTKIAWANLKKPDYLVILVSSYITTATRDYLEEMKSISHYKTIVIEGEELKERLIQFPDLIERFFTIGRYQKLFTEIKDNWLAYNISPSFEVLKLLGENLAPDTLSKNDLGLLFISLYHQYEFFECRNMFFGDFDTRILSGYYERLKEVSGTHKMVLFAEYKDDFSHLAGSGIFEEIEYPSRDDGSPEIKELFQSYTFHLNPGADREFWAIGHYVFFTLENGDAFEIFALENSEFTTDIQFHPNFKLHEIEKLSLEMPNKQADKVRDYFIKNPNNQT